jgi:hypothetical protein
LLEEEQNASTAIDEFAFDLAEYSRDSAGFVAVAFEEEPRELQARILADIRDHLQNPATRFMPCRIADSSGHGVGKTALMGMLTVWALSTWTPEWKPRPEPGSSYSPRPSPNSRPGLKPQIPET